MRIPQAETSMVTYLRSDGTTACVLTRLPAHGLFCLYLIGEDGNAQRLGRAQSPTELEERFAVKLLCRLTPN